MASTLSNETVQTEADFINLAFHLYWKHHRVEEPVKYFSLLEALHKLREATGMDQPELAAILWLTTNKLNGIEIRCTYFTQKQYEILDYLTASYSLPVLADFFESQKAIAFSKVPGRKGRNLRTLGGDGKEDPEWTRVMGDGV
jgi:hypothetical protein